MTVDQLSAALQTEIGTIRILANGFIVTSLLWASALAALIDHQLLRAAGYFVISGLFSLFGIIHSPLPGSPIFLPWNLDEAARTTPLGYAGGYLAVAVLLALWHGWAVATGEARAINEESES